MVDSLTRKLVVTANERRAAAAQKVKRWLIVEQTFI